MTLDLIIQTCTFSPYPQLSPLLLIALRQGRHRRGAELQTTSGAAGMWV